MDLPEQIPVDEQIREKIKTWTPPDAAHDEHLAGRAMRETVEFAVMVVILWLLLRAFEVEPFVIPTGSMAPTLMGRHMDVKCKKCGHSYQTGASGENGREHGDRNSPKVIKTVCPICRYEMPLNREENPNQESFTGDRILVSKLAYQIGDPQRWDVAVFKFPGNPKINYIKRIVGLPEESIKIRHGDIYVGQGGGEYRIARKPPPILKAMLRVVDDTNHIAGDLEKIGWPSRWIPMPRGGEDASLWKVRNDGTFALDKKSDANDWLRYRHIVPDSSDWRDVLSGREPRGKSRQSGGLVTNFVAYNKPEYDPPGGNSSDDVVCWVGDLALECEVDVRSNSGTLLLDLVEGGVHYTCNVDVASGQAKLLIGGESQGPWGDKGAMSKNPVAATKLTGPGTYDLRFSNCDDELRLWIDDSVVDFDKATTYRAAENVRPKWTKDDPLDLAPAGIGGGNILLKVGKIRLLRDTYYLAKKYNDVNRYGEEYDRPFGSHTIEEKFRYPKSWDEEENPFDLRRSAEFELEDGQYFALGDNSPASQDARIWSKETASGFEPPAFVDEKFLTGKAFMVYWPHTWNRPIPYWPNFKRIGFIR